MTASPIPLRSTSRSPVQGGGSYSPSRPAPLDVVGAGTAEVVSPTTTTTTAPSSKYVRLPPVLLPAGTSPSSSPSRTQQHQSHHHSPSRNDDDHLDFGDEAPALAPTLAETSSAGMMGMMVEEPRVVPSSSFDVIIPATAMAASDAATAALTTASPIFSDNKFSQDPSKNLKDSVQDCRVYVGNLSWSVGWQEVYDWLTSTGLVVKHTEVLTLPPIPGVPLKSKGCAIVEFGSPEDARQAIATFNDAQLAGRPAFLREDRVASFTTTSASSAGGPGGYGSLDAERKLFVGNLPFSVSWQDLKDEFKFAGAIIRADVMTHRDTGRPKGAGTVVFERREDADYAIKKMDGVMWGGRSIEVRRDRDYVERRAIEASRGEDGPRRGGGVGGGYGRRDDDRRPSIDDRYQQQRPSQRRSSRSRSPVPYQNRDADFGGGGRYGAPLSRPYSPPRMAQHQLHHQTMGVPPMAPLYQQLSIPLQQQQQHQQQIGMGGYGMAPGMGYPPVQPSNQQGSYPFIPQNPIYHPPPPSSQYQR